MKSDPRLPLGEGGYSADLILPTLRSDVIAKWNRLTATQKTSIIDYIHDPSTGLSAWDITDMTFEYMKKWTQGLSGDVAENTLTYKGRVYPAAEVNYLLWGLINSLAYRDGIETSTTSATATAGWVAAYRTLFGGMLVVNQRVNGGTDGVPLF